MLNFKPTIAMRKEDESAFINARTYWALTYCTSRASDLSYELRVKHAGPEDTFRLFAFDAGDEREILSREAFDDGVIAYMEHEGQTSEEADWLMSAKARIATAHDERMLAELKRHWDAFTLLFNPAINAF